jgi:hypothetical protein
MKNLITLIAAVVLVSVTATVNAQVTGTATGSATVITPISILKTADMSFGNLAVSPTISGTVTLTPAGIRTTDGAGGVVLPAANGTVAAASFTVSGLANSTYSISLPASYTISYLTNNMIVNAFTSTPSATGTLTSGSQVIKVGATLNVGAGQVAGTYVNAAGFGVTVNYN